MTSQPRPIHSLHRAIAEEPHPSEPQNSYTNHGDSYLDDDFDGLLKRNRKPTRSGSSSSSLRTHRKKYNQHQQSASSPTIKSVAFNNHMNGSMSRASPDNHSSKSNGIEKQKYMVSLQKDFNHMQLDEVHKKDLASWKNNEIISSDDGDDDNDLNHASQQYLLSPKSKTDHASIDHSLSKIYKSRQHQQHRSLVKQNSKCKQINSKIRKASRKYTKFKSEARRSKLELLEGHHNEGINTENDTPDAITRNETSFSSFSSFPDEFDEKMNISFNETHGNDSQHPSHYIIDHRIQQTIRIFAPCKRKLILSELNLTCKDIPVSKICVPMLNSSLHKLNLAGNPLLGLPMELVLKLNSLQTLDLHQCDLRCLPSVEWNLPHLRKLDLSFNQLGDFLDENIFHGIPDLQDLNLYGNQISEIILPFHADIDENDNSHNDDMKVLSNLRSLNVGFNNLTYLPDDLSKLKKLKFLNVTKNILKRIPPSLCDIKLKKLEVSANPLVEPPVETCARGIESIRRYYRCIKIEEEKEDRKRKKKKKPKSKLRSQKKVRNTDDDLIGHHESIDFVNAKRSISQGETKQMTHVESYSSIAEVSENLDDEYKITVNDTLKVIFVGMAETGKTSVISRLCHGKEKKIPDPDNRTIGVDIYEWDPKRDEYQSGMSQGQKNCVIDTRVKIEGADTLNFNTDVDVKFSVWDFAGQHVYHATHELFFSPLALYVIVWDMGVRNSKTWTSKRRDTGPFSLDYSDDEDDEIDSSEENLKALHDDIDEKVQFWVDCIQSSAPGAAILPIGSFNDKFEDNAEGKRRCAIMRKRLLYHEERSQKGITKRLDRYISPHYTKSEAAKRLRYLQCDFNRPKLILGDGEDMIRVSSTEYTGFDKLKRKIVQIATGRERGGWKYGLFSGHVGARIPRMRIEIKNLVRELRRKKHFVVEWDFFYEQLKMRGIDDKDDINDALHFLSNVGELAYFGDIKETSQYDPDIYNSISSDKLSFDDVLGRLISSRSFGGASTSQLSQFIFLNPKWLVAAIACILRHDLAIRIKNIRGNSFSGTKSSFEQGQGFDNVANPTISSQDACLLWKSTPVVQKAVEIMKKTSNRPSMLSPYEFLQRLLIRFSVFVPIDLRIKKTLLGGVEQEYSPDSSQSFFLPSLLGSIEPNDDFFTYKPSDASALTLCHSWLFPDCVPPGIMERIMAASLRAVYVAANNDCVINPNQRDFETPTFEKDCDKLQIQEIMCWRTAFYLNLSGVKIFVRMAEQSSPLCVASRTMSLGMKRLTISGQGTALYTGRLIWEGGYALVLKAIQVVLKEYSGLEYEEQVICPECLKKCPIKEARCWDSISVKEGVKKSREYLNCGNAHRVETPLLSGIYPQSKVEKRSMQPEDNNIVKVKELLGGFVLVCIYDSGLKSVVQAGSGFIVDKDRGLIVTAAHTVMCLSEGKKFGHEWGDTIIIGVIPNSDYHSGSSKAQRNEPSPAVFRYFAQIVAKDPLISKSGSCTVDACVLQIVSKLEADVENSLELQDMDKIPMSIMSKDNFEKENLKTLKVREECEVEERVRIIGFSQGGEDIIREGSWLFRNIGCTFGMVKSHFSYDQPEEVRKLCPRKEVIVACDTIVGESGGPCINQQGEVIGILSRGHETRCYLAPTSEWISLLRQAKKKLRVKRRTIDEFI